MSAAVPVLQAPFPWFGGKSRAAAEIWRRFGDPPNYVEPFAGSLAVLLARPGGAGPHETVNDKDGFIANFWRALAADPEQVAQYADWPVNENDLTARHIWLVQRREELTLRLEGDPAYYDAKIAGWWVWGICAWIGGGWCSGEGPWSSDGEKLVHLGDAGQGVSRRRVHLNGSQGVHRQLVHLGDAGQGVHRQRGLVAWMEALASRLRRVRVCCGDWRRVLGESPTTKLGTTAILLDPPYADTAERTSEIYAVDDEFVAHAVRAWAVANGDNPQLRIALCGYEGEHMMPLGWSEWRWKATGGYGRFESAGLMNRHRERIWFSPQCLGGTRGLFDDAEGPA